MKMYGYLFTWGGFSQHGAEEYSMPDPFVVGLHKVPQFEDITGKHGINVPGTLPGSWRVLNFRSPKALAGEDTEGRKRLDDGDYIYRVYVRTNPTSGSICIASRRLSISESAISATNTYVVPKLQKRVIRVAELSERLLRGEVKTEYFITFLSADVPGYGDALRTLSLEGEDIAGASFFNFFEFAGALAGNQGLSYSNFTARRIGLRPVDSYVECGRFGADNRIEFFDDSIQELERFLNYVKI